MLYCHFTKQRNLLYFFFNWLQNLTLIFTALQLLEDSAHRPSAGASLLVPITGDFNTSNPWLGQWRRQEFSFEV